MTSAQEQSYQDKIRWLESELASVTRNGVENAKRFAADIEAERAAHAETKRLLECAVRYSMGPR